MARLGRRFALFGEVAGKLKNNNDCAARKCGKGQSGKGGRNMAKTPDAAPKQGMAGFLGTIERVGNMVPHPAIIFFMLIAAVILLSVIFGALGTSVTYDGYDAAVGDIVEQTTSVRSLRRRPPAWSPAKCDTATTRLASSGATILNPNASGAPR